MGVILVTGGTGKTGARVAEGLRRLGERVRVAARRGGDVLFDWADPATFGPAVAGTDRVYLLTQPGDTDPLPAATAFLDAALGAGVHRFVLLSGSPIPEGGPAMGGVHRLLSERAPESAVLRPTWFMQNFSEGPHAATIRDEGVIYSATGNGRVPFVDADDIAAVAIRALLDEVPPKGDLVITGPRALSYGDVARIVSEAADRPVRHVELSVEALARRYKSQGMEPGYAAILAAMDGEIEEGAEDRTTDVVSRVAGHAPRTFEAFAQLSAAKWRV